ncbi:MAG TPA: SET domain-containing protein, partial [Flavisolibacter sp.]
MKPVTFISDAIYVAKAGSMGRGVFARQSIRKNVILEIAPVIVMTGEDRTLLDQTLLHDYIFEWGDDGKGCCMALGYVPIYNHSYEANCEYEMHFNRETITVKTVRHIDAGEQLFINYNGDWNNPKP